LSASLLTAVALAACAGDPSAEPTAAPAGRSTLELTTQAKFDVHLNHTYGLLEPATIKAIQASDWLKNVFSPVIVQTPGEPGSIDAGTYLLFRDTYLELFSNGALGLPDGFVGLGLGTEQTMANEWVAAQVRPLFPQPDAVEVGRAFRNVSGVQVPWFDYVDWGKYLEKLSPFNIQYVPVAGTTTPETRRDHLAAVYDPSKIARNISVVNYALLPGDRAILSRSLAALGWTVFNDDRSRDVIALSPKDRGERRVFLIEEATAGRLGLLSATVWTSRTVQHVEPLGPGRLVSGSFGLPITTLWFVSPTDDEPLYHALDLIDR
jgi:hypothetical protein